MDGYQFFRTATYALSPSKCGPPVKKGAQAGQARSGGPKSARAARTPRKWSVAEIAAEAARTPGHCGHVDNPAPPVILRGISIANLSDYVTQTIAKLRLPSGRRQRKDAHVLAATICSFPKPRKECDAEDFTRAMSLFSDAIAFHEHEIGACVSAVMHIDEGYLHCHIYTVDIDVRSKVAGWKAKRAAEKVAEAKGSSPKQICSEGNECFRVAMSAQQDKFWLEVGQYHGLARISPSPMIRLPAPQYRARREAEANEAALRQRAIDAEKLELEELVDSQQVLIEQVSEQKKLLLKRAAVAQALDAELDAKAERTRQTAREITRKEEQLQQEQDAHARTVSALIATPEYQRAKETRLALAALNAKEEEVERLVAQLNAHKSQLIELRTELRVMKRHQGTLIPTPTPHGTVVQ